MDGKEQEEGSYPEPSFPEDFGERLERLTELAGLSREEFAERPGQPHSNWRGWSAGIHCPNQPVYAGL